MSLAPNPSAATRSPSLQSSDQQKIQHFLDDIVRKTGIPGVAICLSVGEMTVSVGAGAADADSAKPFTVDSVFTVGCLTKLLAAEVIHALAVEGKLSFADTVADHLPELAEISKADEIRIEHLLSHTSGYQEENFVDPDVVFNYSWPEFTTFFADAIQLFTPGTVFSYQHSNTVILCRIAEHVSGRSMADLITERVSGSLGIGHRSWTEDDSVSAYVLDPQARKYLKVKEPHLCDFWQGSISNQRMTLRQLVEFGRRYLPRWMDRSFEVALPRPIHGARPEELPISFGRGYARYRNGSVGLSSSSLIQSCGLYVFPEAEIALAVGLNTPQPYLRDLISKKLLGALLDPAVECASSELMQPRPESLQGQYQGALYATIRVHWDGQFLTLHPGPNPAAPVNIQETRIVLASDDRGQISPTTDLGPVSLGFFKDPTTGEPALMVAGSSFKKVS